MRQLRAVLTVGTYRRQLISDAEICQRFKAGEPLTTIGKRAGLWTSELHAVLVRNGMPMRTPAEINASKGRRYSGTLRLAKDR
jgi:hypothetical protein